MLDVRTRSGGALAKLIEDVRVDTENLGPCALLDVLGLECSAFEGNGVAVMERVGE